jgi:hypothetical protein
MLLVVRIGLALALVRLLHSLVLGSAIVVVGVGSLMVSVTMAKTLPLTQCSLSAKQQSSVSALVHSAAAGRTFAPQSRQNFFSCGG